MKKIIILFSILVLLCGCSKLDQSVIDARKNLINNIGVTTKDKIVVKNGDDYYVYNISNDYSYVAYLNKCELLADLISFVYTWNTPSLCVFLKL